MINNLKWLFDKLGIYEFLPSNNLIEWAAAEVNMNQTELGKPHFFFFFNGSAIKEGLG